MHTNWPQNANRCLLNNELSSVSGLWSVGGIKDEENKPKLLEFNSCQKQRCDQRGFGGVAENENVQLLQKDSRKV